MGFIKVLSVLPVPLMKKTAAFTGVLLYITLFPYRRLARKHLQLAFPEWSTRQVNSCVLKVFKHFSLAFTDLMYLLSRKKTLKILVDEKRLKEIITTHPRLIFLTGHIGNWELLPFLIKDITPDLQATIVARSQSNRFINESLNQIRKAQGFTMIDRKEKPYRLYSSLAHASYLAFLADQSLKTTRKDWVNFFGRPAPTPAALARIAQKRDFTFLPFFCIRRGVGTYEVLLDQPFKASSFASPIDLTKHYTFIIEKIVRQFPEQWVWFHKRWFEKK